VSCVALGWLSGCVVTVSCSSTAPEPPGATTPAAAAAAAAAVASAADSGLDLKCGAGAGFSCQLLLFSRNHLDFSSVVASTVLQKVCPLFESCISVCLPPWLVVLRSRCSTVPHGNLACSHDTTTHWQLWAALSTCCSAKPHAAPFTQQNDLICCPCTAWV
jgi:hypothetical protein